MSGATNEEAGSVAALTGPKVATAERPASLSSAIEQLSPEEKASGAVEPGAMSEAIGYDGGEIDGADDSSMNGSGLLDRILDFYSRFVCYPSHESSIAHVLWSAHAHLMEAWFETPRLAFVSPEPGSGKSRAMEITALLVPRPELSVGSSSAYILRRMADHENRPTLLFDEIDTIFGPHARGNEDLRGMINSGYRRGATSGRCDTEKGKVVTVKLSTYGAIALGGLGDLPSTIRDRSIVVAMRKRGPGESVEAFRPIYHEADGHALRDELSSWAEKVLSKARMTRPVMPKGIADRNADVWTPLLIVAELAGGRWPDLAKNAAITFVQAAKADSKPSLGVHLLTDMRRCFGNDDHLPSQELVNRLLADEEAPWGDIKGRRLDARKLAKMLSQYGIKSTTLRVGNSTPKGYKRDAFYDAWARYLPGSEPSATRATTATSDEDPQETGNSSVADTTISPSCGGRGGHVAEPENA